MLAIDPITGSLQIRGCVPRDLAKTQRQVVGHATGPNATASGIDFRQSAPSVNDESQPQKTYKFIEYIPPGSLAHSKSVLGALGTRISTLGEVDQNLLQWCECCSFMSHLHGTASLITDLF